MIDFLLFLIFISKSEDLPETKHMEGGVFGWPDALALQKNLWAKIPIPYIRFYKSEINIAGITEKLISGRLNLSLSTIIEEMISSIQQDLDSNDEMSNETSNFIAKLRKMNNFPSNSIFPKIHHYLNQISYLEGSKLQNEQCNKDLYPNAHLLSRFIGDSFFNDIDCSIPDELIGQFLSFILIIVPIIVIFIFSFLFYLFFAIFRCCCCLAKKRFNPGCFCIIVFILVSSCMLISVGFNITSSVYLIKVVDYIFSKKILNEAETVCKLLNPSINDGIQKVVNELTPAISNISNQTTLTIDESLPQLLNVLNSTAQNLSEISKTMNSLSNFGDDETTKNCSKSEDEFNTCLMNADQQLNDQCKESKITNISLIESFTNFSSADSVAGDLDGYLTNISEIMNVTSFIDSGKRSIIEAIDSIENSVNSIENVSLISNCDFHDYLDFLDEIPSFIIPIGKAVLFLMPILMFIFTLIQFLAFLTKNCCSRCLAACCIPCCFCTFCQFLIGLFSTFFCLFVILMNVLYDHGDDVFNTLMKEVTNENRTIYFGSLNLSSLSNNVIGSFPLEAIKLSEIHFIKNFIDAKLDSTLSDVFSIAEMPFNQIADMIEKALYSASETTNLDSMIVGPIEDIINETQSTIPDANLTDFANISKMNEVLEIYEKSVENCYQQCSSEFSELSENYNRFFDGFDKIESTFSEKRNQIGPVLDEVPQKVSLFANELFGGILKSIGETVGETLRLIIPIFDRIDLKWLIGAFNIMRVRFCYNLFAAVLCISISAHLFIVGMTAMTLIVCIRRRGMGKKKEESEDEDSSESSTQKNRCCHRKRVSNYSNNEMDDINE